MATVQRGPKLPGRHNRQLPRRATDSLPGKDKGSRQQEFLETLKSIYNEIAELDSLFEKIDLISIKCIEYHSMDEKIKKINVSVEKLNVHEYYNLPTYEMISQMLSEPTEPMFRTNKEANTINIYPLLQKIIDKYNIIENERPYIKTKVISAGTSVLKIIWLLTNLNIYTIKIKSKIPESKSNVYYININCGLAEKIARFLNRTKAYNTTYIKILIYKILYNNYVNTILLYNLTGCKYPNIISQYRSSNCIITNFSDTYNKLIISTSAKKTTEPSIGIYLDANLLIIILSVTNSLIQLNNCMLGIDMIMPSPTPYLNQSTNLATRIKSIFTNYDVTKYKQLYDTFAEKIYLNMPITEDFIKTNIKNIGITECPAGQPFTYTLIMLCQIDIMLQLLTPLLSNFNCFKYIYTDDNEPITKLYELCILYIVLCNKHIYDRLKTIKPENYTDLEYNAPDPIDTLLLIDCNLLLQDPAITQNPNGKSVPGIKAIYETIFKHTESINGMLNTKYSEKTAIAWFSEITKSNPVNLPNDNVIHSFLTNDKAMKLYTIQSQSCIS